MCCLHNNEHITHIRDGGNEHKSECAREEHNKERVERKKEVGG